MRSSSLDASLVPALRELAGLRLLYLQVASVNIFGSDTVLGSTNRLQDGLDLLELMNVLPTASQAGSRLRPAQTLATVKKRLRLDTDEFIVQSPTCTSCYKVYSMEQMQTMTSPDCTVKRCKGIVYREKCMAEDLGREREVKRIPAKIFCYSPIEKTITRFLLRKHQENASQLKSLKAT